MLRARSTEKRAQLDPWERVHSGIMRARKTQEGNRKLRKAEKKRFSKSQFRHDLVISIR